MHLKQVGRYVLAAVVAAVLATSLMGCARTQTGVPTSTVGSSGTSQAAVTTVSASATPTPAATSAVTSIPATQPAAQPATQSAAPLKPMRKGAIVPPATGAYLGVFHPPAPYDRPALDAFAKYANKKPAIIMWYQQWGTHGAYRFDPAMVASVYKRGAVPMISWEPWDPGSKPHNLKNPADSPSWSLNKIASGKRDAFIRSWARGIKAMGGPVFLRPMHEMNGSWYPWSGTANGNSPQDFVAAWKHIHDIFKQEGATNVTWVWSINYVDKPLTPENAPAVYYPGDEYVDWVSVSGFNWGSTIGQPWKTFDDIFTPQLTYLKTLGKPIMIGETASVEQGGSKPAWIAQTYGALAAEHPEIGAIVYFDQYEKSVKHGRQDWRIQSTAASAKAFRRAVANPYLIGGPIPQLTAWLNGLSAKGRQKLASYPHLY